MPHTTTGLNPALDYTQGWYRITCILKEGNFTAGSDTFTQNGELVAPHGTLATAVSKGDLVSISTDTGNTAALTAGAPVVTAAAAGANFGLVATEPMWVVVPSSSQTTWATQLAGDYYRIAEVWVDCTGMFDVTTVTAGSTAVTPGDTLIWDNSDDGWIQAISGGFNVENGDAWDASGADTGANAMIAAPVALHYSASNTGHVLAAKGLIPWIAQA